MSKNGRVLRTEQRATNSNSNAEGIGAPGAISESQYSQASISETNSSNHHLVGFS